MGFKKTLDFTRGWLERAWVTFFFLEGREGEGGGGGGGGKILNKKKKKKIKN